jgi:hypothetical protein
MGKGSKQSRAVDITLSTGLEERILELIRDAERARRRGDARATTESRSARIPRDGTERPQRF